jgi:hypothetical protein
MAISESGSRMLVHGDETLVTTHSHSTTCTEIFKLHVPDEHISVFIFDVVLCSPITIIHDFHFPTRREGPRDDFRGSFQNPEERTVLDADDEVTCTAGTELPLQG